MLKENEKLEDLQYKNLKIIQGKTGYRFTSDAVTLANFVAIEKGANVVDLCSGSGVVGILVSQKSCAKTTYMVEVQDRLANMSERTIALNGLESCIKVVHAPLQGVSEILGKGVMDCVVCNPPYKKTKTGLVSESEEISIAKHETKVSLEEIVKEASILLNFGGSFYVCNKEERLVEMMELCVKYKLEPKVLKIKTSKKGANIIFIKAVLGGKPGIKIEVEGLC